MVVCFIGHRTITDVDQISSKLMITLTMLIGKGADTFLFGSKSNFDFLCWEIVTSLKNAYPYLKRVSYNAPDETSFTSKADREKSEQFI